MASFCFIFVLDLYIENKNANVTRALCLGWVLYAAIMCNWLSYFGAVAFIAFLVAEAALMYGFIRVTSVLLPRQHRYIFYPIFWIAFEWVLGHLPIVAFPWLTFSSALVDTPIRTFARVGGGTLISFVITLVASMAAVYIRDRNADNTKPSGYWIAVTCVVCVVLVGLSLISHVQLEKSSKKITLTVVQGNDKNRYLTTEEINSKYIQRSHIDLAHSITGQRDIIIFPESAFSVDPRDDTQLHDELVPIAQKAKRLMILNTIATEKAGEYNRNYFYASDMEELGHYDKKRLVPFGEYVPFDSLIGSWSIFDDIGSGFQPGIRNTTIRGVTSLICFESAFSVDVQRALSDDSQLLVITTNNRSYRRSGNSAQHLALTQMRATEQGISVVQASVSGESALIERDGSIVKHTELFKKTNLSGSLSFGHPDSIYSRTGDWLSLCALLVVGYLGIAKVRKLRWKNQTSKS